MTWQVIEADCVEAMREMDEASVDAIVTDPPYGLEFMGKEWDDLSGRRGNAIDVRPRKDELTRHSKGGEDSRPLPHLGSPGTDRRVHRRGG